jgi:hypothetical protein
LRLHLKLLEQIDSLGLIDLIEAYSLIMIIE